MSPPLVCRSVMFQRPKEKRRSRSCTRTASLFRVTTTRLQYEWLGDSFTSIRMLRKTASSHLWLKRDIIGATEGSFFWEDPPKMGPIGKGFLGSDIRESVWTELCW